MDEASLNSKNLLLISNLKMILDKLSDEFGFAFITYENFKKGVECKYSDPEAI